MKRYCDGASSFADPDSNVLFVGDLSVLFNVENMYTLFSQYGNVIKVEMKHCGNGAKAFTGYCFVTFEFYEDARWARQMVHDSMHFGRKLR